jgi:hypothetical protein
MRKVTEAYGEHFQDEDLDLSGATILNCSFHKCQITFNKPATVHQPIFQQCTFSVPVDDVGKWLIPAMQDSAVIIDTTILWYN